MKVRLLSIMLALFMLASLFAFSSCFGKDDTPDVDPNDEAYKAIYQLYYEYETANGNEPTEYEQWLATIRGKDGKDGEDGISPMLRINPDTDYWEISTNNGLDWSSLEVKAIGENGKDGVTPQLRITDSYWEVSYDNGSTWLPLGEKATGEKGEEGNGILKIEFDKNGSLVITYTNGKTETVSMPEKEEHIHKYDDWTLISAINSLYCRTCSECNNTEWKQDETATSEVVWSVIGNILGTDWNYDFVMSLVDEGTWRSDEFNLHIGDSFKIRKDFSYDYYFGKDGMHNAEPYPITTDGIYKIEFKWDELSDSAVIDLIPVHLHTYDSVTVIAPTCTENGYTVYECACTYQYRGEYVTALGHTEVVDEGITATCAREGLTQGSHCSVCNTILLPQQHIEKIVCIYDSVTTAPTCTEQGYTFHKCIMCGAEYIDNFVDALGHTYGEWEIVEGTTARVCAKDGCDEMLRVVSLSVTYSGDILKIGDTVAKTDVYVSANLSDGNTTEIYDFTLENYIVENQGSHNVTVVFMSVSEMLAVPARYINPADATDSSEFEYTVSSGKVTITKFIGNSTVVVIPAYIDNMPVKAIGNSAFANCSELVSVTVPASVETIDTYAFSYCSRLKEVTLNDGLKTIGEAAFYRCGITSIVIPDSVTAIRSRNTNSSYGWYDGAFEGCTQLKSVVIGNGLTKIDYEAFYGCTSLENVVIGDSVTEIYSRAFYGCTSLTDVYMGTGLEIIGDYAFDSCTELVTIDFGDNVKTVGNYAFRDCSSLANVALNSNLQTLGAYCFLNCTSLSFIEIPGSVKTLEMGVFNACTLLKTVILNDGLQTIEGRAFYQSAITSIVIPDSVIFINSYCTNTAYGWYDGAFEGCTQLKSVVIGNGLRKIDYDAFYGCTSLESVVIGDSVTDIYSYAFHGCTSLRNVEMGAGLENIGNYAFDGCTSLADITLGDNVKAVGSYAFQNCSVLVNVDLNSKLEILGSYCFMNCTSLSFIEIPSSVKTIDIGAFYGCSVLKRVLFNEGLEVIEGRAFYGCPLNSIVIPDSVIFINSYCTDTVYGWYDGAFENCRQLRNVVLGSGLRKIDYDAFYGCTSLESVVIGDSVTEIKDYAFYECTALTYVSMGSSLQDIGSYAFANCSLLVTIEIGESVRNIGSYAFFNCYALANVTVSYSVETIGDYSFCNCTALPSIYIPSNVKNIGIYAFADCSRLKAVDFSEGLQCIGGAAFYGCALEELEIPDSVVKIDSYCYNSQYGWYYGTFENCKKLKKVVIGDGAKYIDCAAFRNCTALLEVEIGNSVLEIRKDAFYGCTPLMKVTLGESVETIGSYAFAKCGSLVNINIPTSTKTIGDYAFWDCAFDTIYITYGVTRIGAYAFLECNNLRTLGIGDHVIIIDTGAFSGCTALQHTYIPFSVQSIRDRAFEYCTALESITIERGNLKTIGENIFYGCTNIERIYYKGDEYDWELISINSNNGYPLTVTPYYYRENEPAGDDIGNYWYYNAAGVEKIWNINKDGFYANEYADEVNELYVGVTFWPEYVYDYFKKDIAFKETIAFWESIHVATDPSHLLDAGWISKESIYEIALFDILIASNDDVSPLLKLCDSSTVGNVEAFIDQYFNGKAPEVAELIVGINGVMKYKYFPEEEGKTIEKLCDKVGIVEDVGEALLFVARYCAVRDMGENYISILNAIYADTSNPKDLRMAALNMIDIIESSFGEILLQILDGTIHDAITDVIFEKIVDKVWGTVLNAVGLGALQVVGKGILILGNAVFNMDGIIQSYYTLGVAVNIGLALEKLIVDYEPDYLRCENWSAASQYVDLVSMYENILLKQCDYGKGMTNLKDESLEKMDLQKKLLSDSYVEVKQRVDEKYAAYYP